MANEITITVSLGYTNTAANISPRTLAITQKPFTITGVNCSQDIKSYPTTAGGTAIPLGGLTTLGFYMFKNNDNTNYIDIMSAVSGALICRVPPGAAVLGYFPAGITAPAAIAHTAPVSLEHFILEA